MRKTDMEKLQAAEMRFLRSVKGCTRLDKIRYLNTFILCSLISIKQVQPAAFITSSFNTPDVFQPEEAIISGNKLGSIHVNMLHTLSKNMLVKLYIFKL
jgi:hypothetical protein